MNAPTTPLLFWFENLGQFLEPGAEIPSETTKPSVPTRMKSGIGLKTLGAMIPAHFIIYEGHARVIGQVAMDSTDKVTFDPAEKDLCHGEYRAPRQRVIDWVMSDEFTTPCMLGVVTNANPLAALEISNSPAHVVFIEKGKSFSFNATTVRNAKTLSDASGFDWHKDIKPALRLYYDWMAAVGSDATHLSARDRLQNSMRNLLKKKPGMGDLLKSLGVMPRSGELIMLDAYYR